MSTAGLDERILELEPCRQLETRAAAISEQELRERVKLATGRRVPVNLTRWLIRTGLARWTPDGLVATERTRELAGPMA